MQDLPAYCFSLFHPKRRKTREVRVGDVIIGGNHPIVAQSMTTSLTTDTKATVDQMEKLVDVGCQLVRLTTPTMKDVQNVPDLRAEMKRRHLSVPLVADVHFLPRVALAACDHFEKVRINPGNFADKKVFEIKEYTDRQYEEELERIAQTFRPIVARAKENGVALRIGTNHGSLSDRIMNRFGDTPEGMVESAIEFLEIARAEHFHDMVISMKSSNPMVMVQAYRWLVARMNQLGMDYPLHLGVTEAGEGQDGRIKSAIGIGSLLADGLGDTIRVSLTEDPEKEIPVAHALIASYQRSLEAESWDPEQQKVPWDAYSYTRRVSSVVGNDDLPIGGQEIVKVCTHFTSVGAKVFSKSAVVLDPPIERFSSPLSSSQDVMQLLPGSATKAKLLYRLFASKDEKIDVSSQAFDELSMECSPAWLDLRYAKALLQKLEGKTLWIRIQHEEQIATAMDILRIFSTHPNLGVELYHHDLISLGRSVAKALHHHQRNVPIHLCYVSKTEDSKEQEILKASTEIGSLLCDGIGDSIEVQSHHGFDEGHSIAFQILQATRLRMSKTDYISCPSCGRTLFDLQETTARIRSKTHHLKGVKIAIMGCIVNGPGEMADADFGYVGSAPGKINLFVGKDCVEKNIPQEVADEKLIELIDRHGKWVQPSA
ncbi:MAG: (E)-4-hydroxy-3-methylbut-2-enyl-diphosphate synthase [Bdellovibrionota bacterium]